MNFEMHPPSKRVSEGDAFNAKHPMFRYEVDAMDRKFFDRLKRAKHIIVVGLGGSAIPLKAFVDFFQLNDRIHFLDTVDPVRWSKLSRLKGTVFCIASKSGETLEIKALLAELVAAKRLKDVVVITDSQKGMLRQFANDHKLLTLPIPSDIGGRFTNFSVFHQAVLESCGIKFKPLLKMAFDFCATLQKKPEILSAFYEQLFLSSKSILVLWGYGDQTLGFCQWAQQVIAESLGKRRSDGRRLGITPIVLLGPQDQHSVLQLLSDGPQDKVLWFIESRLANPTKKRSLKAPLQEFSTRGLTESLNILCESTYSTFKERLAKPETLQPIARLSLTSAKDFIEAIVLIQALTEYSAGLLGVNAFDQPGVERGKEIARVLMARR